MPAKAKPRNHEFTLILADLEELTPEVADALYQVIDDGTAGSCNGVVTIDFHRQGSSLQKAVQAAVDDVRSAGFEAAHIETEASRLVEQINADLSKSVQEASNDKRART